MNYLTDAGTISNGFLTLIIILAVWSLIWKGIALWKAARNEATAWFVVMLIINTVGILEILYIYIFSSCCKDDNKCCKEEKK